MFCRFTVLPYLYKKMEIWIDAKKFEGYYEVSNTGKVRRKLCETIYKDGRVANFSQTILKAVPNKKGYLKVYLSVKSKKYTKSLHRIVAESFIENPLNKKTVNHIDCDKTNNHVSNLEWATNSENMRHAFDVLKIGKKSQALITALTARIETLETP